ncbi:MAG: hypothetical protein A2983_00530 [Candidatus Magasanikbacteria bacterium RIFCSPLOWO2_01_FULL_40_15]|uniref:FAD-binding FR-type domain-containing protein n=1 Tax=Candidatus Magasanikbacteria bacterium RIFCSPLOWO2_01_FULL_40_15 TaxID=1798686 RepID=A0A1F6N415_9BACT|nr:MAG: hypothetical protein A3C66_01270 [Candidatus Magasanikbacteria bacterium RIFCSPHIGHO2_02_FULL_41_35]OGH78621.1 MAG: hypothetical protein A2983_00530 [Candidatus Magasanikbacteria bacterium RIFCSPLOWO2_01_FULL_40_15]
MNRFFLSSSLIAKKVIAENTLQIVLARPAGFSYIAGQFIQIQIPQTNGKILRSYSLSSSPDQADLELCVKLLPNGVGSVFFQRLNVGDQIEFFGPNGRFVINDSSSALAFIATGVGIAPIAGMIEDVLKNKKNPQSVYLLFGVRDTAHMFWTERLEILARQFSNFSFDITFSQPDMSWTGLSGRVINFIDKLASSADYYICGSGEMVKDVRSALLARGEPTNSIHFEIF